MDPKGSDCTVLSIVVFSTVYDGVTQKKKSGHRA